MAANSAFGSSQLIMLQRLLIVSHVVHYQSGGLLCSYGPYAREIDMWAGLFPEVKIAAPLRHEPPPGDSLPFAAANISMAPQLETGGTSWLSKVMQLAAVPRHFWRLGKAMRDADAIHVRCPGNLGLLGCVMAPFFRKPRVAKYAGQWSQSDNEPRSWRWQKVLLRSKWWNAPVLVYGEWPDQPPHIVPFFTSILDESQMARASATATRDWTMKPLEVLFVGRLSPAKNVQVIVKAIAELREFSDRLRFRIIGDGPMRGELEVLVSSLNLGDRVVFEGAVAPSKVLDFYQRAHILALVSQTEGWPKAIAEAMAFGLVCIGSNRGLVPQMLGKGRGMLVEPGDIAGLGQAIRAIAQNPSKARAMSQKSAEWGRQFTLEKFREALRRQMESSWRVALTDPAGQIRDAAINPSTI